MSPMTSHLQHLDILLGFCNSAQDCFYSAVTPVLRRQLWAKVLPEVQARVCFAAPSWTRGHPSKGGDVGAGAWGVLFFCVFLRRAKRMKEAETIGPN